MPREYRHIQEYEKEILKLREQGNSYREIGEKFGFSKKQISKFFERYNEKQRKIAARNTEIMVSTYTDIRTCSTEISMPNVLIKSG